MTDPTLAAAAIALVFVLFSLFSRKLSSTVISGPLFFLVAGLLLASDQIKQISLEGLWPILQAVGVIALGLSFFGDASRISLSTLAGNVSLPARLLLLGVPLTFLLGMVLAAWLLPELVWLEAALLAIILTPADTGQIALILSSPRVPVRIRQALNVESSLNDGLTTPIAAMLIVASQSLMGSEMAGYGLLTPLQQLLVAVLLGVVIGGLGGWALRLAERRQWIVPTFLGLVFPAIAMLTLALTAALGGNYFVACFMAGGALGFFIRDFSPERSSFSETLIHLLSLIIYLFLGASLINVRAMITWPIVLYAVLSLTVIRLVPVAVSMLGKGLQPETLFFMGWSGPRGLASIVLATIVIGSIPDIPHSEIIVTTVVVTVSLSVLVHGFSTIPLLVWYGRRIERLGPDSPENQPVDEIPFRLGWSQLGGRSEQRVARWEERRRPRGRSDGGPREEQD